MNVTFRLRFSTQPGQSLWLAGEHPLPGHAIPMKYHDAHHWQVEVPLSGPATANTLRYSYQLRHADGSQATDWGADRRLVPADFGRTELLVLDSWNQPGYLQNAFSTAPFQKVFSPPQSPPTISPLPVALNTHTFQVKAPLLESGQTLCLLGEGEVFGNWQTARPILMQRTVDAESYSVSLDLRGQRFPFNYKYGVFNLSENSFVRYEEGPDRTLVDAPARDTHTLVSDGFLRIPPPAWRGAGVAVPVFSLRSRNSFGVGEFLDLIPLADWGKQVGLKLIQLLPVNDTGATATWKDSYPYAAISAFALHPQYLNLAAVASAKNKPLLKKLEPQRKRLNAMDAVDYEAVMKLKLGFLRKIFPSQKAATFRAKEFKKFFAENESWLVPYAAFCFLRDKFGTVNFNEWPEHKTFSAEKIAALAKDNEDIAFHYFIQYHLHLQLKKATAHVHKCGLVVKGDIAIGVYRHGADAWQEPELYHMEMQAGAPPDPFAAKGQNWGFPTYNWTRMAADGFAWWKRRFAQMGNYFDAFRIDHILGFFRIWSIPLHAVEGIMGYFVPALPVEQSEFAARGIHFDRDRLTKPFINDAVLQDTFGANAEHVRNEFLLSNGQGLFSLKPEFTTQRQVEKHFANHKPDDAIKFGLYDLISNVILFEVEGKFHFRLGMEQTASFKHLPNDQQAKLHDLYVDYFFRRQDDFWMREAMQKLPALKRVTNMLVCGEDLGMVPACVPEVMKDLGFLSLEIQRMPKALGVEFSRPADAPYLSVVTPSTHDMSTIRGWWAEDAELTQKFFQRELGGRGEAPREATPEIVEAVVRQHLASPAMWSIFQLQDLLGMDGHLRRADVDAERINVPAIPQFYWRYRLHLSLEQLQGETGFNARLAQLLRETGR